MRNIKGWVYGHYDSRGGTSFVVANTQKEADQKYFNAFWKDCGLEEEEWWAGASAYVADDRIGPALLAVPNDFDVDKFNNVDLEGQDPDMAAALSKKYPWPDLHVPQPQAYWDEASKIPMLGKVIGPGSCTDINTVDDEQTDEESDFVGEDRFSTTTLIQLEFVPTRSQPQVLKKFAHPRWNDDAYSFMFYK